jgi:hypothetical protein
MPDRSPRPSVIRPSLPLALLLAALLGCGASPGAQTPSESGGGGAGGSPAAGGSGGGSAGSGGTKGADGAAPPDTAIAAGGGGGGGAGGGDAGALPADSSEPARPDSGSTSTLPAPPATWMEHWFEHNQLLALGPYNDDVALYFDKDVNRADTPWILPAMTKLWQYVKRTYGPLGGDRLFAIFHQGKYGGGHPSTYFDDSHDFRNVSDSGPGPWAPGSGRIDIPSHESGHVVEIANNGVHGSPAFPIWGDSKWMEFFQYDAYVATGMTADAERVLARFTATSDDFPRAGTRWFRDWFYPLWRDHGHAAVMVKFFALLAQHFPKRPEGKAMAYTRDLDFGEFVHFMSGAAGTDLKPLATTAFGWPAEHEAQFAEAKTDFPAVTY